MNEFENVILRWVCLFDDFKGTEYSNLENLVSSNSFKGFVNNVFCYKCSLPTNIEDEKLYNTIKVNYDEFEVQKYEDLYNGENSIYTCLVVLLHALLKCADNKFRDQLSERMNDEEQVQLANFLGATQSLLFTKQTISDALMLINCSNSSVSDIISNNTTPIKSKSMRRSYLQEFCESPKSQSLICQEKEKIIAKLTEDYKNECEENYKLAENVKILQDHNIKLGYKLEDKDKVIKCLKEQIEEFSKPIKSPDNLKIYNTLKIKKLNQDILDLEMNNRELKQQIAEIENKHEVLNGKYEKESSNYQKLLSDFYNIEAENGCLKENIKSLKNSIQKKDVELTSIKDELSNKSITNIPSNNIQEANCAFSSNTLFDELSSIKLEEMTRDKEKYRHKYKSLKKDLLNNEKHVEDLDNQIKTVKQQLNDCEVHRNELCTSLSEKKKELQEIQKKNNSLETKLKYLKDSMKDKENRNECLSTKLNKKEKQIKEMSVEMDTLKKAKTMIELILSKTNTEIEALHEENTKYVKSLIENHKELEEKSRKNIIDLENNIKNIQEDLAKKESIIIFYEEKMAENYQTSNDQEDQIKAMDQEKLSLESQLKNMKTEIETQQKIFERKYSEMENWLEYHINELKDVKSTTSEVEEMLHCKQKEINRQTEIINHQKNIIETLQSEKCGQEISINNLKDTLHQKSIENIDLQENVKKSVSSLNKLNEEFYTVVNEKLLLQNHLENIETQIKTTIDEFQEEINHLKNTVEHRSNEIDQCKIDLEKLKDALEKKQNDFNEQLIISNKHIETVSLLRLEKHEIEEKLKSNKLCLLDRENEIKTLQDKVIQRELKIKNLSEKFEFKILENQVLSKNLVLITSGMKNMQGDFEKKLFNMNANIDLYGNKVDAQTEKLFKLNDYLIFNKNELKTLVDLSGKQKENIMNLGTEKLDLLEKITVLEQNLLDKNTEILNLGQKLQNHNSTINNLKNDVNILKTQNSEYSIIIDCIEKQIIEKNQLLNDINVELKNQIQCGNEQREIIIKINTEKEFIYNKIIHLEETLSLKECELNLSKEKLYDCSNIIKNLEAKLDQIKNEKISLELQLNETITQLNNDIQDITLQLKSKERNELQIQEQLINKQNELEKQTEKSNDQIKMISFFNVEKDQLLDYTNKLQECLNEKDYTLKSLEEIIMNYKNQHEESVALKMNLKSELDEQKKQLANLHQESKQQLESMEKKCTEIKDKLNKKQVEVDECINKYNCQEETIALLVSEKDNLIEKTNMLSNTLLKKESVIAANQEELLEYKEKNNKIQIEKNVLEMNLKETFEKLDITCQDFAHQLNIMENKVASLNEELNRHCVNSEIAAKESSKQKEVITILTSEKHNLINETNTLNKHLVEKENILASNHIKMMGLEKQLEELKIQKICLESNLNESKVQMENNKYDLTEKLETAQIKLKEVQEQLINQQINLNEQTEKISILTSENKNLVDEINRLNECLAKNEHILTSNENKLLDCDKQKKEMECQNASLMFELNQLKCQLNSARQECIEQIAEMDKKLCEVREQLSLAHSEKIKKQIELKNDSLIDIYQKINDLKSIKNELELVIRKEKKDFETCLETYSSFSINCLNNKHEPHEDSLMEVITSADTFIEQNGIQLEQVENCDDYSIIERLKKLFEALKMFIININTQGNDRAILHTNNEYVSREVHAELLTKSNMQLKTISHLETEMSKLKAECNYKMSKVQQKTQEYVTSEYEKKFERKREQMKQFCKDLEIKMHQDFEAKLKKYKEKINKDEIHIKELGQQLWEVSDKYLRLQQKERRESTMSLPFEMSAIAPSTVNVPKYNSFTLPKSSSAGQIRSLVEENTRSYQDKRNVPLGIGKKFSLSSGKIFPKEEDEEGEMFNHSCLADLKIGKVQLNDTNDKLFNERVSELQARNSLCPPHLKSCYAVETNYLPNASLITEEDIRTIINYSDCESENLIPNDRNKKKDRNQTSYKKPGPPTPSKNGGRVSLSGNTKITLKDQKESVVNKRRGSSTPNKLFSFFGSKK